MHVVHIMGALYRNKTQPFGFQTTENLIIVNENGYKLAFHLLINHFILFGAEGEIDEQALNFLLLFFIIFQ